MALSNPPTTRETLEQMLHCAAKKMSKSEIRLNLPAKRRCAYTRHSKPWPFAACWRNVLTAPRSRKTSCLRSFVRGKKKRFSIPPRFSQRKNRPQSISQLHLQSKLVPLSVTKYALPSPSWSRICWQRQKKAGAGLQVEG